MSKVFQIITDRILEQLKDGVAPWRSPIRPPFNVDGWPYRGSNFFLLGSATFGSPVWYTPRQIAREGGRIRKGERAHQVVYWIEMESRPSVEAEDAPVSTEASDRTRPRKKFHVPRYTRVFNYEQLDGVELPERVLARIATKPGSIEDADRIVAGMPDPPRMVTEGGRAFYRPSTDTVKVPPHDRFESAVSFASVRFHELVHSTGHARRLDRGLSEAVPSFGSADYSFEELVAEMGAAFLMATAGLESQLEQSASYISGWLEVLQSEPKWVVLAGSKAQRSADWITGELARREHAKAEGASSKGELASGAAA